MPDQILKSVADNPILLEALKTIILAEFNDIEGVDVNKNNEDLGAVTRARLEGVRRLKIAFRKIEQLKSTSSGFEKRNEAR